MILLADANVLIDLWNVGDLGLALTECVDPRQPGIVGDVTHSGIQMVETRIEWLQPAGSLQSAALSLTDSLPLLRPGARPRAPQQG